jgi:hypothetical protein
MHPVYFEKNIIDFQQNLLLTQTRILRKSVLSVKTIENLQVKLRVIGQMHTTEVCWLKSESGYQGNPTSLGVEELHEQLEKADKLFEKGAQSQLVIFSS